MYIKHERRGLIKVSTTEKMVKIRRTSRCFVMKHLLRYRVSDIFSKKTKETTENSKNVMLGHISKVTSLYHRSYTSADPYDRSSSFSVLREMGFSAQPFSPFAHCSSNTSYSWCNFILGRWPAVLPQKNALYMWTNTACRLAETAHASRNSRRLCT